MKPSKLFHTVVIVGAALAGSGCADDRGTFDAGPPPEDGGAMIADAAMDAAAAVDAGAPGDAGEDAGEDAMVLIL